MPLGHPGDSLGSRDGDFPLTPPKHWRLGERPDGKHFAGTSLHTPATEENASALRELRRLGFRSVFVPHAAIRLAQGAGRLIRTGTDKGVVAILDSRLHSAGYGRYIRRSLPPLWYTTDPDMVRNALRRLADRRRGLKALAPKRNFS